MMMSNGKPKTKILKSKASTLNLNSSTIVTLYSVSVALFVIKFYLNQQKIVFYEFFEFGIYKQSKASHVDMIILFY